MRRGVVALLASLLAVSTAHAAGETELLAAAAKGDAAGARAALAQGADINAADSEGRTALLLAAYGSHTEAARVLIDAGADLRRQDRLKNDVLNICAVENCLDIARLAIAKGAPLNQRNRYGGVPIIPAAGRGHVEMVALLIAAGSPVDHVNDLGWTALLEAVIQIQVQQNEGSAALARAQKDAETVKVTAEAIGEKFRLEGRGEAGMTQAIGTANAQSTKLSVDAYGGPEYRLAEQNFARFAEALTKIDQPIVPQFLMSGSGGTEGTGGLIPTALLSTLFSNMMPDALQKLKNEAPPATRRGDGAAR